MHSEIANAPCPKCHSAMAFVVALPYAKSTAMLKTTFVCSPCNRTLNYVLSSEMAAQYQPESEAAGRPPNCPARPAEQNFMLKVDGRAKRSFADRDVAIKAGHEIKKTFPVLNVLVVDRRDGTNQIC